MIQQFQPKHDSPSNVEPERSKSTNNSSPANAVVKTVNTIEQMPFTVVTKVTPIANETTVANHDKT